MHPEDGPEQLPVLWPGLQRRGGAVNPNEAVPLSDELEDGRLLGVVERQLAAGAQEAKQIVLGKQRRRQPAERLDVRDDRADIELAVAPCKLVHDALGGRDRLVIVAGRGGDQRHSGHAAA
jgi:hypothetical protein